MTVLFLTMICTMEEEFDGELMVMILHFRFARNQFEIGDYPGCVRILAKGFARDPSSSVYMGI
jgi:hypothetical protein